MRRTVAIAAAVLAVVAAAANAGGDDEALRRYVMEALGRNLDIEMSRTDVVAAQHDRDAAAAAFYPTAGFNYRHTRINTEVGLPIDLTSILGMDSPLVLSEAWQWQAAFSAQVPIYLGGTLRHGLRMREAAVRSRELLLSASERDVALQVIRAYLDLKMALALKEVQAASLRNTEEHRRSVAAMLDQGMVSLRELKRAEAAVARAESELIAAENSVSLAVSAFNHLLNRDLDTEIDSSSETDWSDEYRLDEMVERALSERPELQAMDERLQISDEQIGLALSSYRPSFTVAAEGGWRDGDMQSLEQRDYWSVSVLAGITLFDSTRDDRVASSRAAKRLEELSLESGRKRIELEVTQSYLRLVDARKQLSATEREKAAAEEARRVAELQFKQGVVNQVTYLDAEFELTAANERVEQARYRVMQAEASLRHASGYRLP